MNSNINSYSIKPCKNVKNKHMEKDVKNTNKNFIFPRIKKLKFLIMVIKIKTVAIKLRGILYPKKSKYNVYKYINRMIK
jgi:hypothetical protein